MKNKQKLGKRVMRVLSCLALLLVMQTANTACIWVAHQPEFPNEANRYKINK